MISGELSTARALTKRGGAVMFHTPCAFQIRMRDIVQKILS
jgi:hypothetical protein